MTISNIVLYVKNKYRVLLMLLIFFLTVHDINIFQKMEKNELIREIQYTFFIAETVILICIRSKFLDILINMIIKVYIRSPCYVLSRF